MTGRDTPPRDALFARAAAWVARLDAADCTRAERAAFEEWLAADPARVRLGRGRTAARVGRNAAR